MAARVKKLAAAKAWLQVALSDGKAHSASDILTAARLDGHAQRTMQLASTELGVKKTRVYEGAGVKAWHWSNR